MCHFITLVVRGADEATVDAVLKRHGRRARPVNSPSVASVLDAGSAQFLTYVAHCDCGTVLAARSESSAAHDSQVAKLAKKGWSAPKIERWLADRVRADEKRSQEPREDSFALWSGIIDELLALKGVKQAGLLVHFYSGSVEGEAFKPTRSLVEPADFSGRLESLREDELLLAVL